MPDFERLSALLDQVRTDQPPLGVPVRPLDELTFSTKVQLRPGHGAVDESGIDDLSRTLVR
jgi:hypothetical protein